MKRVRWILVALVLFWIGVALFHFALALRLLALVFSLLGMLGVLLKVLTFRRPRPVTATGLLFSTALSLGVLVPYLAFMGVAPPLVLSLVGMGAGVLLGWHWSRTERLMIEEGTVKSRGSWASLLIWAAVLCGTQFLSVLTGQAPLPMIVLMLLGTGIALGFNLNQLVRCIHLRRAPA